MLKYISGLGYTLLIVGLGLLSPLADLLPVEMALLLSGDFTLFSTAHYYYRIVPSTDNTVPLIPISLALLGVLLLVATWLLRRYRTHSRHDA